MIYRQMELHNSIWRYFVEDPGINASRFRDLFQFFFAAKCSNGAILLPIGFVSVMANWKLRT